MATTNETTTALTIGFVEQFLSFTVIDEDGPLHTDARPFCDAPDCPCHEDIDLVEQFILTPWREGLLTNEEGERLHYGQQFIGVTGNAPRYYMLPCDEGDPDCYNVYDRLRTNGDGQPYYIDSHLHESEARALIAQEEAQAHTTPFDAFRR